MSLFLLSSRVFLERTSFVTGFVVDCLGIQIYFLAPFLFSRDSTSANNYLSSHDISKSNFTGSCTVYGKYDLLVNLNF